MTVPIRRIADPAIFGNFQGVVQELQSQSGSIGSVETSVTALESRVDVAHEADGSLKDGVVTGKVGQGSGTIAHGGTIPLPSGYTAGQCIWLVSINSLVTRETATLNGTFGASADASRVVSCTYTTSSGTNTGTANYVIIGVK